MPKSSEQNKESREKRIEQIKEEALKQFASKGIYATKIGEIAKELGVAQGLIYHYYDSKDDLYSDLLEEAYNKIIEAVHRVHTLPKTAVQKLDSVLKYFFTEIAISESFAQTCRLISQTMSCTSLPERAQITIAEKGDKPYDLISDIIWQGQIEDNIIEDDPHMLSILFWSQIYGFALYATTHTEIDLPDYSVFLNMFLE